MLVWRKVPGQVFDLGCNRLARVGQVHPSQIIEIRDNDCFKTALGLNKTDLLDGGYLFKDLLEFFGKNLLSGREHDHLLRPAGDEEITVLVPIAKVAGKEPAVLQYCGRLLGLLVITEHHVRPTHRQFSLTVCIWVCNSYFHTRYRNADGARLLQVKGAERRGFRQSIAFDDPETNIGHVPVHVRFESGSTACSEPELRTELGMHRLEERLAQIDSCRPANQTVEPQQELHQQA